jgi:adenylate cyclase
MGTGASPAQAARRVGVTPSTLRRWIASGVVPADADGTLSPGAVAHARVIARLRDRGHTLAELREATASGRLAFSFVEEILGESDGAAVQLHTLEEAAARSGLEPALAERVLRSIGFAARLPDRLVDDDVALLEDSAAILAAGFPLVAFLQATRVYGQALSQIADAEVRLFHLYVHEPLMRDGVPGWKMAEQMEAQARALLPMVSPLMERVHRQFLTHFVEQDIVGHMETDLGDGSLDLGRVRVAIAFADLAGYTRLTEEEGDAEAVSVVERFVERVEGTLPDDARIIKTIGDEVMVVAADGAALVAWAVRFQESSDDRPLPRIGIHAGAVLYRDGDYYGREVNQAARVAARAAGGEVLVTRPVCELSGPGLDFRRIGEVRLKGFSENTELFVARSASGGDSP